MRTQPSRRLFAVACLTLSATAFAASTGPRVALDVTVDGTEKWEAVLNNIDNVKTALGDKAQVRVIAHGKGLGMLIAVNAAGLKDRM